MKERKHIHFACVLEVEDGIAHCEGRVEGLGKHVEPFKMDAEFLAEAGIKTGDQFRMETSMRIERLEPKPVSPEQVEEITEEF